MGSSSGSSADRVKRSSCPIANALDLLGDKWTLLVIRDLLFSGKRRFADLANSPERIPTNILTDRLRRLERERIVSKSVYHERPLRYEYALTPKGRDVFPVLRALIEWANRNIPGTATPPADFLDHFAEHLRDPGESRPEHP